MKQRSLLAALAVAMFTTGQAKATSVANNTIAKEGFARDMIGGGQVAQIAAATTTIDAPLHSLGAAQMAMNAGQSTTAHFGTAGG